ncbi:hypothetical protein KEJ27_10370 [Candidatus Bathyarchaeota archaeon]|nr:hypothetical protein [Candidatus Bathyarchaeota archaeon]MBS7618087.1 hypothetical protein [Candidatus Bathyarchaeota archaeon]
MENAVREEAVEAEGQAGLKVDWHDCIEVLRAYLAEKKPTRMFQLWRIVHLGVKGGRFLSDAIPHGRRYWMSCVE